MFYNNTLICASDPVVGDGLSLEAMSRVNCSVKSTNQVLMILGWNVVTTLSTLTLCVEDFLRFIPQSEVFQVSIC